MKSLMLMFGLLLSLLVLPNVKSFAQTEPDDATTAKIQAAKTATTPVFDLGRLFGDLLVMESKSAKLVLSKAQASKLLVIMKEIKATTRLTPEYATKTNPRVKAILSDEQRKLIAQIATQPNAADGNGTNRAQFLSYAEGGAFNPMTNAKSLIGQDFAKLFAALERRVK